MNHAPRSGWTPSGTLPLMISTVSALLLLVGCGSATSLEPFLGGVASSDPLPTSAVVKPARRTAAPTELRVARRDAVATRVVVSAAGIDLPVISRDRRVSGQGPDQYPPCDVALYHTSFGQPGQGRTTYLYGHAREGMFLPLLTAAERNDGASLIGARVDVYTSDNRLHVFTITRVKRHATGFALVDNAPRGAEQLILQTSEGPRGTVPKLQVLALPDRVEDVSHDAANPRARPKACYKE